MRKRIIRLAVAFTVLSNAAAAQTPAMTRAYAKPASAPRPATTCTLVAADGGAITDLTPRSPTGRVSFWTDFTATCDYTGSVQTFTIPAGADHDPLVVQAYGAAGGRIVYGPMAEGQRFDTTQGGRGAGVRAVLDLPPGTALQIRVGGAGGASGEGGAGGYNGGGRGGVTNFASPGGGGASDMRVAPFGEADRILVAGGGGGGTVGAMRGQMAAYAGGAGGFEGAPAAAGPHSMSAADYPDCIAAHVGGYGGTQTAPGAGGQAERCYSQNRTGPAGIGGAGGTTDEKYRMSGSGGGGGWFGGGAGAFPNQGGGGGGSSHVTGDANAQFTSGARDGHGQIVLQYRVYTKRVECQNRSAKTLTRTREGPPDPTVVCQWPGK